MKKLLNPVWVIIIMAIVCIGLYIGLSYMATESLMDEGVEEGGLGGILLILTSSAIGSSIYTYPLAILFFGVSIGYTLYYLSANKKNSKWRR
jgi:preprotein translocase subunit SecG